MTDTPVLIDFESRSRADLDYGGRGYWAHPSTEALCCAWYDVAADATGIWFPGETWPHHERLLGAHNMTGFDRFGAIHFGWMTLDDSWIDTSELARRAGLPGALDALATRWLGRAKDKEASKFTRSLSSVKRPAALTAAEWKLCDDATRREFGDQPVVTDDALARVAAYCASDVEILVHGWPLLESWQALEPDVLAADRAINDRGVYLDVELCRVLLVADELNADVTLDDVARSLGWTVSRVRDVARSPKQFCEHTGAADARKETVDELLANSQVMGRPLIVHALARARRAVASIARGKLEAGLARVSPDSRLRDTLRYYGAHTGRWSGQGMQLQNLPRPPKYYREWSDVEVERWTADDYSRLVEAVKRGDHCPTSEGINILLRACLCAAPGKTLAVCDYAGVEARALAWMAGDVDALDVFRSGRDPYRVAASKIYGCSYDDVDGKMRGVGKIAELACGYGMGATKLYANYGAQLDAAGIDAQDVITSWRDAHRPSVHFWYQCNDAFIRAVHGDTTRVSCLEFAPSDDGRDVMIWLPSGRPIVYTEARIDSEGSPKYLMTKGWEHLYGGKIVENIDQALCRDLLAGALVRAEARGLAVVMHAHDEPVAEVDAGAGQEALDVLRKECMLALPGWAESFPVGAAGYHGERYHK